jgi:cysteine desulfurase
MIYFDHAATTPLHPQVLEAMMPFLQGEFGNPSSLHHAGKNARHAVETAREQVAALFGARPAEVILTSGATEGNNHALKGLAAHRRERGRHIVSSQLEHDAVLHPLQSLERDGFEVTWVAPERNGIVDASRFLEAVRPDTIFVSLMHANNEMGTLQPITEVASTCRQRGVPVHVDACQTVGHIPLNVHELGADVLTCSGHKFYGPKGAGATWVRRGVRFPPLIEGGHQQKGRRAGTENVPGLVGMGVAAEIALDVLQSGGEAHVQVLRDRLVAGIESTCSGAHLNGDRVARTPGIANFSFEGIEGEGLILELDARAGVCCSTGSACAAGSLDPSPVLLAIGLEVGLARAGTRFSLGRGNTAEEVDAVVALLPQVLASLRRLAPEAREALVGGQTDQAG